MKAGYLGTKKLKEIKIEKTESWITIESALQLDDGRAVRGFLGNIYRQRSK